MPKQLSSLEMHFISKELEELESSRVDKIYNRGKDEFYFQFHKRGVGKRILKIIIARAAFFTDIKSVDESPSGFCMFLRKHLEGKFLESLDQLKPERILKLVFRSKNDMRIVYLEFFAKGNLVLCNEDNTIIDSLGHHKFKERTIFPKEKYKHPIMKYDFFDLGKDDLENLFKNSIKDKLITSLAVELGLGGVYSEEVCLLSKLDKNTDPKKIKGSDVVIIINSINKMINKKINASIVYKNNEIIDVMPFSLEFYKDDGKKEGRSFSEALDLYFSSEFKSTKKDSAYDKKINELKRIIGEQKATIENMRLKEEEMRKKGEEIYNNYQIINEILDEINKASKKYPWDEIKKRLKGHKVVKDISLKEKTISIIIN